MNYSEDTEQGLWDLTACCRFYQTGVCEHTEAVFGDYEEDDSSFAPVPVDDQASLVVSEEVF